MRTTLLLLSFVISSFCFGQIVDSFDLDDTQFRLGQWYEIEAAAFERESEQFVQLATFLRKHDSLKIQIECRFDSDMSAVMQAIKTHQRSEQLSRILCEQGIDPMRFYCIQSTFKKDSTLEKRELMYPRYFATIVEILPENRFKELIDILVSSKTAHFVKEDSSRIDIDYLGHIPYEEDTFNLVSFTSLDQVFGARNKPTNGFRFGHFFVETLFLAVINDEGVYVTGFDLTQEQDFIASHSNFELHSEIVIPTLEERYRSWKLIINERTYTSAPMPLETLN